MGLYLSKYLGALKRTGFFFLTTSACRLDFVCLETLEIGLVVIAVEKLLELLGSQAWHCVVVVVGLQNCLPSF